MNKIEPFVKWVGGKRQVLKELEKHLPKKYNTYYEPFVGGGALLFHIQPKSFVINDLNSELINCFRMIKTRYKRVREYLLLMEYGHSEALFKAIRNIDRNEQDDRKLNMFDSKELRAARFIYLNKAGFNGIYRVNSQGYFNVPSGKKEKVKTHEYPNIVNVSKFLKESDSKILNKTFDKAVASAKKDDFVYFDPPYDYDKGVNGFDAYQKEGFGTSGQIKLASVCKKLNEKGVKFMVSNHNTELIKELYAEFNINVIKVNRLVGGKGSSRKPVEEVIITNYES